MSNEFTELDLQTDISDMDEEEAKETLSDFMAAHKENQVAYDEKVTELEEVESEYSEEIDELEERLAKFREQRAEDASEYVNMPAGLIAERFSHDEIEQIIEEAESSEEFTEDETDEGEDEDRLTTFSERDEKGRFDGGGSSENRSRAADKLRRRNFPASE